MIQRGLRAPEDNVVNLVALQIAKCCGVAPGAGEEVLVDAQILWTSRRVPFGELALEMPLKVALDGGRGDALAPAQSAAVDAVQVLCVDELLKQLS